MLIGLNKVGYAHLHVRRRDDQEIDPILHNAFRYADLSEEERTELAVDAKGGDQMALRAMMSVHSGLIEIFVRRMAARIQRAASGIDLEDLRQEGRRGLIRAIERYNPERGKFSTYAAWWIRARIYRYVQNNLSVVRVPVWASDAISARERRHALRTSIREAVEMARMPVVDVDDLSLGAALNDDDERRSQLRLVRRTIKALAVNGSLSPRLVEIIMRRYTSPGETLEQVATSFGISRERVRQLELSALDAIRRAVVRPSSAHSVAVRSYADLRVRSWLGAA